MPGAAGGMTALGQPLAGAMCTVGIRVCLGAGKVGDGPVPAASGNVAMSPHAATANTTKPSNTALVRRVIKPSIN